jgi:hypothetical protein
MTEFGQIVKRFGMKFTKIMMIVKVGHFCLNQWAMSPETREKNYNSAVSRLL